MSWMLFLGGVGSYVVWAVGSVSLDYESISFA